MIICVCTHIHIYQFLFIHRYHTSKYERLIRVFFGFLKQLMPVTRNLRDNGGI